MRTLITGATGFVGGHLAEAVARRGRPIHVIARPSSDTRELEQLGATVFRGELDDPQLVRQALVEVDTVVHCAAKVGDWGPLSEYRKVNVESLRVLLDACKGQALSRFVHLSSLGVYAARHHHGTDETVPASLSHRDGYSQSKAEAEALALGYCRDFGVPVVVLRPGFVYGPRDRIVLPRIVENLRLGRVRYPGAKGMRLLNTIFVRNLVDAVLLAIDKEEAVGEIFNLTDGEAVTKRRFIEKIADAHGLPRPTMSPPYWLAWLLTWSSETLAKARGAQQTPLLNFTRLKFLGMNLDFSIEKARAQLGYAPRVRFDDAMNETLAWQRANPR